MAADAEHCAGCASLRLCVEQLQAENARLSAAASTAAEAAGDVAELEEEVEALVGQLTDERETRDRLQAALVAAEARYEALLAAQSRRSWRQWPRGGASVAV